MSSQLEPSSHSCSQLLLLLQRSSQLAVVLQVWLLRLLSETTSPHVAPAEHREEQLPRQLWLQLQAGAQVPQLPPEHEPGQLHWPLSA